MTLLRRAVATCAVLTIAATALVAAPAARAEDEVDLSDEALVGAWYGQFLGRSADFDAQHWTDRLGRGDRVADVVWALTHTREYDQRTLDEIYFDYLGREARYDTGARYWIDGVLANRFPLEWAAQNVLASDEYYSRWGVYRGNRAVAEAWYEDVLGREASRGESEHWASRSDAVGRLTALRELWYSAEAVRRRLGEHYRSGLLREADPSGLSYWYPVEVESDINVQVLMAATSDYRVTHGTTRGAGG